MLSSSSSSKPRSSPLIQEGTPPTLEKNILSTFLTIFSKESSTWGIPSHQDEAAGPLEGPTMCRPQNTLVKECFVRSSKTLQAQQEMSLTWETGDKNEDKLHLQLLPRFLVSNYQKLNPYLTWPRMVLRETATIIVNISNWEKYFFFWKIHFSIWINTFWFFINIFPRTVWSYHVVPYWSMCFVDVDNKVGSWAMAKNVSHSWFSYIRSWNSNQIFCRTT